MDMLRNCWIDTYLGPPDLIAHDAGKNFVSNEFRQYAINLGTTTKSVPVEAHNSVGLVERYHGPLRRIYKIITDEVLASVTIEFETVEDAVRMDGATLPNGEGHKILCRRNRNATSMVYSVKGTFLMPQDDLVAVLRRCFPVDNFRLYNRIVQGISLDE